MFDVITFGGATRDIFFKTSKGVIFPDPEDEQEKMLAFKYGQKIITDNALFSFGGGALNTAVSMNKLGLKVATHINIGRDESAHSIVERLRDLDVDTSLITTDPVNHTALSLLVMDKKDHVAFLHRGANNFLKFPEKDTLKNTKWFYITSLTGKSAEILPELINFANKHGIKIILNPGGIQLKDECKQLKGLLEKVELIILNREEAETLVCSDESCEIIPDTRLLLAKINKMGPKRIIITEGERGSYYFDVNTINFEQSFKAEKVVDTTGAGDAFGSTFVASVIKGYDIQKSLKLAAVNASNVTEYIGAQEGLLTEKEIKAKLKKIKIIR